jgi:hypothetical protein
MHIYHDDRPSPSSTTICHLSSNSGILSRVLKLMRCIKVTSILDRGSQLGGPGFELWSGHVGFEVDKAALRQVSFEYFGFSCKWFRQLLHVHHHPSSGVCTIDPIAAGVPSRTSLTPHQDSTVTRCLYKFTRTRPGCIGPRLCQEQWLYLNKSMHDRDRRE